METPVSDCSYPVGNNYFMGPQTVQPSHNHHQQQTFQETFDIPPQFSPPATIKREVVTPKPEEMFDAQAMRGGADVQLSQNGRRRPRRADRLGEEEIEQELHKPK